MDAISTKEFLEERENKLGAKIVWKSYSPWHASTLGLIREFGVFIYTDGKTLVFEDFEKTPTLMGIPVESLRKHKYEKYERLIDISTIIEVSTVTRSSAEASYRNNKDVTKKPNLFGKLFRKLVTKVKIDDGTVYFFELMDRADFENRIMNYKKGE